MIYDELKNFISLVRKDNTVEIFDSAVSLFDAMGEDNYMQIFEATMGASSNLTEDETVQELLADIEILVESVFRVQGIAVVQEVLLSDKIKIAKGLLDIFDYSDRVAIMRILETDMNPEEQIAEVLTLVCDIQSEEAFAALEEVKPEVITRMKSLFTEQGNEEQEDSYSVAIQKIVASYSQFKENLLESGVFYTDKYLESTTSIGLDYEVYLTDLLKYKPFQDLLSTMDNAIKTKDGGVFNRISMYLIGISILSIDGSADYGSTIRSNLMDISSNISHLAKLEAAISENLIKLNRAPAGATAGV